MPLQGTFGALSARALRAPLGPTDVDYTYSSYNETDLTTYEFSSVGFGTTGRRRHLVVATAFASAGAHRTVSSFTVGGVSGSELATVQRSGGGAESDLQFYIFPASALGADGTVSITLSGGCARCGIFVWAVYNLGSPTAFATASQNGASPHTLNLNTPAGGVVLGAAISFSTPTMDWTGLTEDDEAAAGFGNILSGASAANVAAESPRSVSVSISTGGPLSLAVSLR